MGDLNCDMIATRYDNDTRKLASITDIYGLQQLITEPTRITPTSATLIGAIFTNCPDRVVCSGVRHISISDHSLVFAYRKLSINGTSRGHNVITYRNFRKFSRKIFLMMLHLNVETKYTVQPIRMICGYNGKGCFSLSLTNMPP